VELEIGQFRIVEVEFTIANERILSHRTNDLFSSQISKIDSKTESTHFGPESRKYTFIYD